MHQLREEVQLVKESHHHLPPPLLLPPLDPFVPTLALEHANYPSRISSWEWQQQQLALPVQQQLHFPPSNAICSNSSSMQTAVRLDSILLTLQI